MNEYGSKGWIEDYWQAAKEDTYRDGWHQTNEQKDIVDLYSQIEIPFNNYENKQEIEHLVKQSMAENFAKELLKYNAVLITKDADMFGNKILYKGKVKVVSDLGPSNGDITKVMVPRNTYVLDQQTFTEEEIQKALYNSYPEKFI